MENVYDLKIQKNLNFILPIEKKLEDKVVEKGKVAIIIHLHYKETLDFYMKYLENIPYNIKVFITTSNEEIKEKIFNSKIDINYSIVKKLNRGRDISAFLVACREKIQNYEYICFLHDKKEKDLIYKNDIKNWTSDLWENTIGSEEYITNVLYTFYNKPTIGLLVPPPPIGDHFSTVYKNAWYKNFKTTRKLIEEMHLECDLDVDKSPITFGTVFWARVPALKKLFDIKWKYEDFDEEPMESDGTISHAIERSLAYIAQDAGYETGWIMTDRYAGEKFDYMISVLGNTFHMLEKGWGIECNSEIITYNKREKDILNFVNRYDIFYIYGVGDYGKRCFHMLQKQEKRPKGFIVSDGEKNEKYAEGIPVYELSQINSTEFFGVIVAVCEKYRGILLRNLHEIGLDTSNIFKFEKE